MAEDAQVALWTTLTTALAAVDAARLSVRGHDHGESEQQASAALTKALTSARAAGADYSDWVSDQYFEAMRAR